MILPILHLVGYMLKVNTCVTYEVVLIIVIRYEYMMIRKE